MYRSTLSAAGALTGLLLATLLLSPGPLRAQPELPAGAQPNAVTLRPLAPLSAPTPTPSPFPAPRVQRAEALALEPHLHQSFQRCGKKWLKKARALSADQQEWMLRRHHDLYRVKGLERTLLTIELLSTASFRSCDLEENWDKRETTIRMTYLFPDGTTKVRLSYFHEDDIFFTQAPKVYTGMGKALFSGVNLAGRPVSRWVALEPLTEVLHAVRVAEQAARPVALVASR